MLFYTLLKGIHINLYTCKGLLFCLRPGIVKTVVIGKLNPKFIRNDNSLIQLLEAAFSTYSLFSSSQLACRDFAEKSSDRLIGIPL